MCNEKKDFSLLRPFDLEAAKAGAEICFDDGDTPATWFIHDGMLFVEWADESQRFVQFASYEFKNWRMAPLCWVRTSVEDDTLKPVYKGDVLYNSRGQRRTVTGINENEVLHTEEHGSLTVHKDDCTWTPPNVKRKI